MNLSVLERLVILKALPVEGNYATLKILTNLRMSLSFTEEEMKAWEIVTNPETGQVTWQNNGEADIPIGEKATDIIVDAFKKLDGSNKLPVGSMSAYEKFISLTE